MAKKIENNVGKTLSTEDIVKAMAEKSKDAEVTLSQKECIAAVNYLKAVVTEAVATGYRIQMTGLMSLQPSYRSARKGNNVITGELMDIPETVIISIKAGKSLKDAVKDMPASLVKSVKLLKKEKAEE